MTVGSRGMFVGKLAMVESRCCVRLRLFVLAEFVMMGRLMVMMRGGVVERRRGGDAHPPDASVTVPFTLLPKSEQS